VCKSKQLGLNFGQKFRGSTYTRTLNNRLKISITLKAYVRVKIVKNVLPLIQHNGQKDGAKTKEPRQDFYCKSEFQLLRASAVVWKMLDIFTWYLAGHLWTPVWRCAPNFVAIPPAVSRWWTTLSKSHNRKAVFFALDLYTNLEFGAYFGAKV